MSRRFLRDVRRVLIESQEKDSFCETNFEKDAREQDVGMCRIKDMSLNALFHCRSQRRTWHQLCFSSDGFLPSLTRKERRD